MHRESLELEAIRRKQERIRGESRENERRIEDIEAQVRVLGRGMARDGHQ